VKPNFWDFVLEKPPEWGASVAVISRITTVDDTNDAISTSRVSDLSQEVRLLHPIAPIVLSVLYDFDFFQIHMRRRIK
jgi:hypothetical protein